MLRNYSFHFPETTILEKVINNYFLSTMIDDIDFHYVKSSIANFIKTKPSTALKVAIEGNHVSTIFHSR